MNPNLPINGDDLIAIPIVVMAFAFIVLPTVTLGIARKWSQNQPQLSGAVLAGAVTISLLGILCATFVTLVVLGWMPSLSVLLGKG